MSGWFSPSYSFREKTVQGHHLSHEQPFKPKNRKILPLNATPSLLAMSTLWDASCPCRYGLLNSRRLHPFHRPQNRKRWSHPDQNKAFCGDQIEPLLSRDGASPRAPSGPRLRCQFHRRPSSPRWDAFGPLRFPLPLELQYDVRKSRRFQPVRLSIGTQDRSFPPRAAKKWGISRGKDTEAG
jgi:hypothetical protein